MMVSKGENKKIRVRPSIVIQHATKMKKGSKSMKNEAIKNGALGNKAGVIKSGVEIGKSGNSSKTVKTGPAGDLRSKG